VKYNLSGKVAIVTGASAGLGEQFCYGLAESGANVVLAARRIELLKKVSAEIEKKYRVTAVPIQTDVRSEADIIRMVDTAVRKFGTVDILVNNAGVAPLKSLVDTTLAEWQQVVEVNLTSAFLASREVARTMIPRKSGCIVSISSTFGFGATTWPLLSYYATKGGLIAMTKALAVELGKHNIRVNAIAPGYFPTDMSIASFRDERVRKTIIEPRTALPMLAENEWIRGALCFLASEDARYITGHTLAVDGGWLAF